MTTPDQSQAGRRLLPLTGVPDTQACSLNQPWQAANLTTVAI